MGDENNLVPESEDTSALFVSSQKKKKAEEEARRRAEEEQAKRDAAAAEVRRMEQEVEERRKKAEEEKLALENEEKMTAEERAKVAAQRAADKAAKDAAAANKAAKPAASPAVNSKLFIIIGVVVAVLVLAFVIVKVVGKGGGASDYSQLGANGEYVPKASGFDVKILYPNDVYTEVTETKVDDDNLQVFFKAKGGKDVTTNMVLTTFREETSKEGDNKMLNSNIALFDPETIRKGLTDTAKKQLTSLISDASVTEEKTAEYSDDNPTTYTYDCTFTSGKYKSGTAKAWLAPNSANEYLVVMVCCFKDKADNDGVASMRDLFVKNNTTNAFAMPGAIPPTSMEVDGMVEVHDMHMGLHVPKDKFVKFPHTTNYDLFSDLNGATIIVKAYDLDMYSEEMDNYDWIQMLESPKEIAKTGINTYQTNVTSRVFLTDKTITDDGVAYVAEYKDVIGGVTYWERFSMSVWTDVTTDKVYWATIITLAPEKNKDQYRNIFDKMLDTLEDI